MWICKICKTENNASGACTGCGFDPSLDYETLPTFALIDAESARPASKIRREYFYSIDPDLSPCGACGSYAFYYDPKNAKLICAECGKRLELPKASAAPALKIAPSIETKLPEIKAPAAEEPASPAEKEEPDAGSRNKKLPLRIVPVSIGFNHVAAVRNNGMVVAAGNNSRGQCDVGSWMDIVAVSAGFLTTVGVKRSGTVIGAGFTAAECLCMNEWKNIVSVACGKRFVAALDSSGRVHLMDKSSMTVYDSIFCTAARAVFMSGDRLFCITDNGKVLCQSNIPRQMSGAVSQWENVISVAANESMIFGLKEDGTVEAAVRTPGRSEKQMLDQLAKWDNIVSISASANQLIGLKSDGRVKAVNISGSDSRLPGSGLDENKLNARLDDVGAFSFGHRMIEDWTGITAAAAGDTYTIGIKSDGSTVIAGITTLDSQIKSWKGLMLP